MVINAEKTKLVRFHRGRRAYQWDYALDGSVLEEDYYCKYLGITFTKDLQQGPHINRVVDKAYRALHFIIRVLGRSSLSSKEIAYKSLVRPILEYGAMVWDPHAVGQIKQLELVQRTAARYVLGDYRRTESVTKMLEKLGWE